MNSKIHFRTSETGPNGNNSCGEREGSDSIRKLVVVDVVN